MDISNATEWVKWVFSGIGCLLLTWIATLLFSKRKTGNTKITKKAKMKGNNDNLIQNSENCNININK